MIFKKTKIAALELQRQQIEEIFQDAFNTIQEFAEDYWEEYDENRLNRVWKQKLNQIKFEQRIKIACDEAAEQFNDQVKESLEEIGKELQLISELNSSNFSFKSQDLFDFQNDFQNLLKIVGSFLGLAGAIMFLFPSLGITAITLTVIGIALNWVSRCFKSREEKRREAVVKISNSLESQLKKEKSTILKQTESNLSKYCSNVSENTNQYFNELIQGLEAISSQLEKAQKSLDATVNYLNYGYAKRIIDWATEKNDTLTIESAKRTVAKVQRDFAHSIDIKTKNNIELKKSLDEMKQVLQEDISIESIS